MDETPPISAELMERALRKFKSRGELSAVFAGESGATDQDGRRWKFVVTDGNSYEVIEGELSGSQGGERGVDFEEAGLEGALEKRVSGRFPIETRLSDARAASPITLWREDL
jgi:hypothetical protein